MSDNDKCEPTVTSCVTSAALPVDNWASTRKVAPRPTAAAAVIRASCPPPTMPTAGMPVTDFRSMGPAGPIGSWACPDPAGDNRECTRCSLRGTAQSWVQPTWQHEAAASRHLPFSQSRQSPPRRDKPVSASNPGHACKQGVQMTTLTDVEEREGNYGDKVLEVEPGGAEFIPLSERHGRPLQLFWTWTSPNMEFATIFVGVLAVAGFGLGFWEAALALVLGSAIGGLTQGILSLRGPKYGVPQMVLSRFGFGYWGNILPAGLNSVTAGIGWFAVNSVSGALALNVLTHLPQVLCLIIIVAVQLVVAFFGYNLVHVFERYAFPILTIIFLIAAGGILSKAHPGTVHHTIPGAFLIELGASFGYAVGWNPYASDYTRYFKPDTSKKAIAWWSGAGLFLSCAVLEIVGAP